MRKAPAARPAPHTDMNAVTDPVSIMLQPARVLRSPLMSLSLLLFFLAGAASGQGLVGGGGLDAELDGDVLERPARREPAPRTAAVDPEKFTFYPMGGVLGQDLMTTNYVDLDTGPGLLDWDCTEITYDGHDASDGAIRGFDEQEIGVPVFAAADGLVFFAHDGEPDRNTVCGGISNTVKIRHPSGRETFYYHLKNGSVAVFLGQEVRAGQQIGLTASSGCSTGPHLHFATYDGASVVEPYAGACRPGASEWVDQPILRRELYLWDLNITDADVVSYGGPPFEIPRTGTFVQGLRRVEFWIQLINKVSGGNWRVRFIRPDTTVAYDSFQNAWSDDGAYRNSWWSFWYNIDFNQTGIWTLEFRLDGVVHASAPLRVVSSPSEIVNRAPYSVSASLEPAEPTVDDVLTCRVSADLIHDDPDYDVVRYLYEWKVDGVATRTVTSAAHSDVFPRLTAPNGSLIECTVTPSDGTATASAVTVSKRLGGYVPPVPFLPATVTSALLGGLLLVTGSGLLQRRRSSAAPVTRRQ